MNYRNFRKISIICIVIAAFVTGCLIISGCQEEDLINENISNMEYIDIPEVATDPIWFMDKERNDRYFAARRRFWAKVSFENGYYKAHITSGKEISISEQLFNRFNNGIIKVNQDVKDGKYELMKRKDGGVVRVQPIKKKPTLGRIKRLVEDDECWVVDMDQSSQDIGMELLDALNFWYDDDSDTSWGINDFVNFSTGSFSETSPTMSGTFDLGGCTYNWYVANLCGANGYAPDCSQNQIITNWSDSYANGSGIYMLRGSESDPLLTIYSNDAGSYSILQDYFYTH